MAFDIQATYLNNAPKTPAERQNRITDLIAGIVGHKR